MRLLFVIDNLNSGGAQRQLAFLAIELSRRGHEVDVFCYTAGDHFGDLLREVGIAVHFHIKPSRYSTAPIRALRRLVKSKHFDVIWSSLTVPNLYAILAIRMLRNKPKLIISELSCAEIGKRSWRQAIIEKFYRYADHVMVNSHHMREHYLDERGWPQGRVTTIWNGLDLDTFHYAPPLPPGDELKLIAVGNMAEYKNWNCLCKALAVLRDEYQIRAIVSYVGRITDFPEKHHHYLDEMRDYLRSAELEDQWEWLGRRSDIPELIQQHDALVHPSYREGLPNVVCEGLASGRPVIVTNRLEHPRIVQDGETGYLFDWTDPKDLAKCLARFYHLSDEEKRTMGIKARQFAEDNFSLDRMVSEFERLFQQVVSPNTSTTRERVC